MKTAIIIDDERSSGEMIKFFLKDGNVPIKIIGEAECGITGIEMINKLNPDIVFLDIKMPGKSGIEVMEDIYENSESINIIVVTAYDYFEYAQSALRLGAKDILLKPIDKEQLYTTIKRVIGYNYTDNHLFNQVLEYINKNYARDISLSSCADLFHTSSNHISRLFKRYTGVKYSEYINVLRIKRAKELLGDNHPIKEVALDVGYNNLNYFYKKFKKATGMTPRQYQTKT